MMSDWKPLSGTYAEAIKRKMYGPPKMFLKYWKPGQRVSTDAPIVALLGGLPIRLIKVQPDGPPLKQTGKMLSSLFPET
jgi:hypothetical protein